MLERTPRVLATHSKPYFRAGEPQIAAVAVPLDLCTEDAASLLLAARAFEYVLIIALRACLAMQRSLRVQRCKYIGRQIQIRELS
jgi:hypothetical protein